MALICSNSLLHIAKPSTTKKLLVSKPNKGNNIPHLSKRSTCSFGVKCIIEETVGSVNQLLRHRQNHHPKHDHQEDHQQKVVPLLALDGVPPPAQLPFYDLEKKDFPQDFFFGASTSALQIEGRGDEGGRGEGTWDSMIEADKGMKAVDSYNLYKEDVKLLKEMGMTIYRFSISWSRILPNGTVHSGVNEEGINYYNNLIDELLANGITPMVTLLHFDLPQIIQDEYGGFLKPAISELFASYADLCFKNFGDRVKYWETINEPLIYVYLGKKMGFPPQLQTDPNAPFTAYHNIILAHSHAAKLYKKKYQKKQGGKIGVSLPINWSMPYDSDDPRDLAGAEASLDLSIGWFLNPLVHGDYPEWLKQNMKALPKFTEEEKEVVKNAYDFIGVNYYTSRYSQQSFSYDGMTGIITVTYTPQTVNARDTPISFEELHEKLITKEVTTSLKPPATSFPASVNAAQHRVKASPSHGNYQHNQWQQHSSTGSPQPRQQRPYLGKCQWCREQGHSLGHCPTFKGQFPSITVPDPVHLRAVKKGFQPTAQAPQAHVATASNPSSHAWLLDSGASHHVTNDLANLSLHAPYDSTEELVIGDGSSLPIQNTGAFAGENSSSRTY